MNSPRTRTFHFSYDVFFQLHALDNFLSALCAQNILNIFTCRYTAICVYILKNPEIKRIQFYYSVGGVLRNFIYALFLEFIIISKNDVQKDVHN